ncbi:MAG: chorismate-binding protein [Flavobacteriales bacterium]
MHEPCVWWRSPGSTVLYTMAAGGDDAFVFAPFEGPGQLRIEGHIQQTNWPISGQLKQVAGQGPRKMPTEAQDFHRTIEEALSQIGEGAFEKVVLSRHSKEQTQLTPEEVFRSKCEQFPDAFVYLWYHPLSGIWLGATPELLVASAGEGKWETVSLAGTLRRGDEVTWTIKEREEQEVVTRYILARLEQADASEIRTAPASELGYGDMVHLQSRIGFQSRGDLLQLAKTLHPTPAVAGNPLEAAMQFILDSESLDRQYYAGFLGPVHQNGKGSVYVNLRCMWWTQDGVIAYAGAGIVSGSNPEDEWLETEAKLDSILHNLVVPG